MELSEDCWGVGGSQQTIMRWCNEAVPFGTPESERVIGIDGKQYEKAKAEVEKVDKGQGTVHSAYKKFLPSRKNPRRNCRKENAKLNVDSIKEEMFDMGDKTPKRPPKKKKTVKKVTVKPTIETGTTSVKKPKK